MQGRLENELKDNKKINELLSDMPEFVNEWYLNFKAGDKTSKSCLFFLRTIRLYLASINPILSEIKITDVNRTTITEFFISVKTKTDNEGNITYTSDSYRQSVWCIMNSLCKFLYKSHYIPENYMDLIAKPKNKDLARIDESRILLNENEFNKILKAVKNGVGSDRAKAHQDKMRNRDLLILMLFMTTGMRKTALSEINISDINFETKTLTVVDKGNKTHFYELSDEIINLINKWLVDRKIILDFSNTDALFVSSQKSRLSSNAIYMLVTKYCDEGLGYHISPHKLRAGFCSILYKKTGNIEFVRRTVGHTNIATTQRYIQTEKKEKKQAMEIMSGILKL